MTARVVLLMTISTAPHPSLAGRARVGGRERATIICGIAMCWETTAIVEREITMSMSATEVSRRVIVRCRSAIAIHD